MSENNRSKRTQRRWALLFCLAVSLVLTLAAREIAQVTMCSNAEVSKLRRLGGQSVDSSCSQFEVEGVIVVLTYKQSRLATFEVESKESLPMMKYEKLVRIARTLKALGPFLRERPIGIVEPSGWTNRVTEYSKAYVVRKEQTWSGATRGYGVKKFTVFYWLPLVGRITSKRTDEVEVKGFAGQVNYYVTIDGSEVGVSESDFRRLKKGQVVGLEATLGNDLARLVSRRQRH
jgi:hypothetical protein